MGSRRIAESLCAAVAVFMLCAATLPARDWPQWGYDAARSGASPAALELPETLHLQWVRALPPPRRAWPKQWDDGDKLEFDLSYSPIVMDGRLFVASMTTDSLTAYDAASGEELWRFYADGPMRVAPAAWEGRVYTVSDDGRLYCLDAATGAELWRYDGAPGRHRTLGNTRVISMWAARGGPVIKDGVVYFASGVWPFLGTAVHALDARSGAVQWANTGHATEWQAQPHGGAYSFAGLAPQGYLAAAGDRLVVSGGRSFPAIFDRRGGTLLHSQVRGPKVSGGYRVQIHGDHYFNHGLRYALADGATAGSGEVTHEALDALQVRVAAVAGALDDAVFESLVAHERLYVTTHSGYLFCFGAEAVETARRFSLPQTDVAAEDTAAGRLAARILEESGQTSGYALVLGAGDGELIEQLVARSDLQITVLEPERTRVDAVRRRLDRAGLYGTRVAILPGTLESEHYPAYISSLLVAADPAAAGLSATPGTLARIYERLRPYDGQAWLGFDTEADTVAAVVAAFTPENGRADRKGAFVRLVRTGPLPDTGQWTHQHADAAQSVLSRDQRVRPPFGPIWFGGPTHANILPRHAAGPRPQVAGGRLVILGVETISARCVFTGRELWVREFPGIGHPFTNLELEERWEGGVQVYMTNQPGATYIGSPYVSLPDSIYLRYQKRIQRLDPETGATLGTWDLPARPTGEEQIDWGHISSDSDRIITTTNPHIWRGGDLGSFGDDSWDGSSSERLVVLDRFTGEVAWTRDAAIGFRHNAIASANGILFVNDLLSEEALNMALRRGMEIDDRPRLYALDLRNGEVLWTRESDVFGTFLSYSTEHDILIEGGTTDGRRRVGDEPSARMIARRGSSGEVLWERAGRYHGPVILRADMIIPSRPGAAICLLTGGSLERTHPLTGEAFTWSYWKTYGCSTANASEHLLLFRSGAAGFTDLNSGHTGSLGGFKSGCTASMIAADGVLNAPDYTRTCGCSYQNQTSLGLIHMPEMELWTADDRLERPKDSLLRAGLNLGAPGDRRAENDTLWVHYPQRAPAPELDVLVLSTDDPVKEPVMIMAARGLSAFASRPEYTLDGDAGSAWAVNCRRRRRFDQDLTYELTDPSTLDRVQMAWRGPDDTRFQIQTSLDGEAWETVFEGAGRGSGDTLETYPFEPSLARLVRVHFGEHGDTREDSRGRPLAQTVHVSQVRLGTLAFPGAYAYFTPKRFYRQHALTVDGAEGLNWVAASGMQAVREVLVRGIHGNGASYDLTLHFSEPDELSAGERRFAIRVGGQTMIEDFDIVRAAGSPRRAVTLAIPGVTLADDLKLEFLASADTDYPPILSGLEMVRRDD